MLARVPHPYAVEDAQKWFDTMPAARACGRGYTYAIAMAHDGVIGAMGLEKRSDDDVYTLGYWFGKPSWGYGFATEAGTALLAYATEDTGETEFRSEHFVENEASGRVLQKLSFTYTGEVRDMTCLARGQDMPARGMERTRVRGGGDA
jgi:RimJ/RimL family protein N-acetyltransferase